MFSSYVLRAENLSKQRTLSLNIKQIKRTLPLKFTFGFSGKIIVHCKRFWILFSALSH